MVEFFEGASDIAWHGDINIAFVVVPVEGEAAVQFSVPVDGQVVVRFDGFDEMHGVGFGEIFHAEIVDAKSERGALCAMVPETWGERHGFVSSWFQFLDELVDSENAGFLEAVHAATDFEVDVAVIGNGNGVAVIVPDFFWNDGWTDSYVLEVRHGRAEVEVFDVEAEVAGSAFGIGICTVDVELGVEHGDGW
jgi:hypothetical protein